MMHNCTINDAIMLAKILDSVFFATFLVWLPDIVTKHALFFTRYSGEKKPGRPLRPGFAQERIFFISAKEDNPAVLSSL